MQDGDEVDNSQSSAPRPSSGLRPVHRPAPAEVTQPSLGKVVLVVGVGCLTFVGLMSVIVVVAPPLSGRPSATTSKKKPGEAAEVAKYSDFTAFKPGDPLPEPPLDLPRPPAPASRLGTIDLTEINGPRLATEAERLYRSGKYEAAVQCQYYSVLKSETGYYNLACFYALAGDIPAALFWLQVSAKEEMANPAWALKDEDLVAVRKNPRWPILLNYMTAYQWKWEQSGRSETSLVLPLNATAGQPLPVFIGLHHTNANAHIFIDAQCITPRRRNGGGLSGSLGHAVLREREFCLVERPGEGPGADRRGVGRSRREADSGGRQAGFVRLLTGRNGCSRTRGTIPGSICRRDFLVASRRFGRQSHRVAEPDRKPSTGDRRRLRCG